MRLLIQTVSHPEVGQAVYVYSNGACIYSFVRCQRGLWTIHRGDTDAMPIDGLYGDVSQVYEWITRFATQMRAEIMYVA